MVLGITAGYGLGCKPVIDFLLLNGKAVQNIGERGAAWKVF